MNRMICTIITVMYPQEAIKCTNMSDRNCICKLLYPIYSRFIEYLSDKEKMTLTHLKLSLNEDFGQNSNYTAYNTMANECVDFFEGVYEYGCPGKRSTLFIVFYLHAIDSGSLQVNFDHELNSPR